MLGCAHSLAAMHAAAHARNLAVRMSQLRIELARIHGDAMRHALRFFLLFPAEAEYIPHDPLSLPWLDIFQLFRKTVGVGRG